MQCEKLDSKTLVSTHSRPKAAGGRSLSLRCWRLRFNSQPPEGGWASPLRVVISTSRFNSQPPEGGWTMTEIKEVPK